MKISKVAGWIIVLIIVIGGGVVLGNWLHRQTTVPKPGITLGAALALTGPLDGQGQMDAAGLGQAIAAINAKGGVNGKRLLLITRDTQSTAAGATAAINELAATYAVPFIIGPTDTTTAAAAAQAATAHHIALISPSAAVETLSTPVSSNLFTLWWTQDQQATALVNVAAAKHVNRIGILTGPDTASQQLGKILTGQLKANHIMDVTTAAASPDFNQIESALGKNHPQILFVLFSNGDGTGPLLVDVKKHLTGTLLVGNFPLQNQTLIAAYGNQLDGLEYIYPHYQGAACISAIKNLYATHAGRLTDDLEFVPAYDAGLVAANLLKNGGMTAAAALARLPSLSTNSLCGWSITFNKEHRLSAAVPFEVRVFKNGQYVLAK